MSKSCSSVKDDVVFVGFLSEADAVCARASKHARFWHRRRWLLIIYTSLKMAQHTCAPVERWASQQEHLGPLRSDIQHCSCIPKGKPRACEEVMWLRRTAASSVSEPLRQCGRLSRRLVMKRKLCPSARAPQPVLSKQMELEDCEGHRRSVSVRGVKRLHGDMEELDFPRLPAEALSCGSTLTSPVIQGGTVNQAQPRAAKGAKPHFICPGRELPEIAKGARRQGGTLAAPPAAISGYTPHDLDSDAAEKEAEIRAQVLNGVRQLLQDESEIDCLVQLCQQLREKKTALLERAIHRRGVAECMELLEEALNVEANGGMVTAEGRRRTPGGVFLRLLQDRISREDKRFIWDEQNREQRRLKRERIRMQNAEGKSKRVYMHCNAECSSGAPSAARQQSNAELASEEREPGELDADEVEALNSAWI